MIRLVTSDIDGTLLLGESRALNPLLYEQIGRLRAHGIRFCAASGRQYYSLRRLFAPVADEMLFICENGAAIYAQDRLLSKTPLPRKEAECLIAEILARRDCEVLISGANMCYLLPKTQEYVHMLREKVGYRCTVVSDAAHIPEDILKVSAYRKEGGEVLLPVFAPKWERVFNMAIAGPEWLDFTLSDKGTGLSEVCRLTGISPSEVMSFGDNYNDVPLLSQVGTPYIMEGAAPALREQFALHCKSVEKTLQAFLCSLEKQ